MYSFCIAYIQYLIHVFKCLHAGNIFYSNIYMEVLNTAIFWIVKHCVILLLCSIQYLLHHFYVFSWHQYDVFKIYVEASYYTEYEYMPSIHSILVS